MGLGECGRDMMGAEGTDGRRRMGGCGVRCHPGVESVDAHAHLPVSSAKVSSNNIRRFVAVSSSHEPYSATLLAYTIQGLLFDESSVKYCTACCEAQNGKDIDTLDADSWNDDTRFCVLFSSHHVHSRSLSLRLYSPAGQCVPTCNKYSKHSTRLGIEQLPGFLEHTVVSMSLF